MKASFAHQMQLHRKGFFLQGINPECNCRRLEFGHQTAIMKDVSVPIDFVTRGINLALENFSAALPNN